MDPLVGETPSQKLRLEMAKRIEVPTGWLVTIMGDEDGMLVARNGKTGKQAEMTNLQVPFPGPGVIEGVLKEYKVGIKDSDGHTHSFTGAAAACAEAWKLYMEYLRGLLRPGRKYPVTQDQIRKTAAGLTTFGKRDRVGGAEKLTEATFDEKWAEAMDEAEGDESEAMILLKAKLTS